MRVATSLIGVVIFLFSSMVNAAELYEETLRPRFHFTADKGYINDPNGLVYLDGTYHLFFQHEPMGRKAWGHATSTDLVHWTQHDDAIEPRDGFQAFSGCAVLDAHNTSGLGTKDNPPVVAVFTRWGNGQAIAYSTDRCKTFAEYEGNPILALPHDAKKSFPLSARDPHVMWDAPRSRWVMVLYDTLREQFDKQLPRNKQGGFSVFTSPNLKDWTRRSHLPGFYVCPDVFELPIEDEAGKTAWVAMDWAQYTTGDFDGETFTPAAEPRPLDFGTHLSANQSWKNLPDGRHVQICWVRDGKYPKMPFEQQMSFPTTLSLRRIAGELRLCKQPVEEIARLYSSEKTFENVSWEGGKLTTDMPATTSFDASMKLELKAGDELEINVLGHPIVVTSKSIRAHGTEGKLAEPLTQLRILADITTIEIFANRGELSMTYAVLPKPDAANLSFKLLAGEAKLTDVVLHDVGSAWEAR